MEQLDEAELRGRIARHFNLLSEPVDRPFNAPKLIEQLRARVLLAEADLMIARSLKDLIDTAISAFPTKDWGCVTHGPDFKDATHDNA